jgi:hypothetical protein
MSALGVVAIGCVLVPLGVAIYQRNVMGTAGFAGMLFYGCMYWFRVGA